MICKIIFHIFFISTGDQNKFSATPFNLLEKTSIEGKEAPKGCYLAPENYIYAVVNAVLVF